MDPETEIAKDDSTKLENDQHAGLGAEQVQQEKSVEAAVTAPTAAGQPEVATRSH